MTEQIFREKYSKLASAAREQDPDAKVYLSVARPGQYKVDIQFTDNDRIVVNGSDLEQMVNGLINIIAIKQGLTPPLS